MKLELITQILIVAGLEEQKAREVAESILVLMNTCDHHPV